MKTARKIILLFFISVLLLFGCGKTNNAEVPADAPAQDAGAANTETQEETTIEETTASAHVIEGWPDDVPAPDFGGELEANNPGKDSINLTFRGIDPVKAAQYVQKLKDAGFNQWVTEEDKLIDVYVDANGNNVTHHTFIAAKGSPVYNDLLGGEMIENGYYIEVQYSDVDEYLADEPGKLASTPKVKIFLDWENPLVNK